MGRTDTITDAKRSERAQLVCAKWDQPKDILLRVREECVEAAPAVVPLNVPKQSSSIHIVKNDLQISLPADISSDTLVSLVHELC